MANGKTRNLDYKVTVDIGQAERDLKRLASVEGTGGESAAGAAAEKTAKSLNKLEQSAGGLDKRMLGVTRAFAGMAAGMAASYAARYFAEGSSARTAMDYGGAALSGAGAGEIERILSNLKETEQTFKTRATEAIEGGRYGEAADYQRNLGDARNRQGQLEALLRNLDKATMPRESFAALDSLSKIGASFGGGDLGRDQLNVQREMAQTLRSIDQKTKTGGSTWQ